MRLQKAYVRRTYYAQTMATWNTSWLHSFVCQLKVNFLHISVTFVYMVKTVRFMKSTKFCETDLVHSCFMQLFLPGYVIFIRQSTRGFAYRYSNIEIYAFGKSVTYTMAVLYGYIDRKFMEVQTYWLCCNEAFKL